MLSLPPQLLHNYYTITARLEFMMKYTLEAAQLFPQAVDWWGECGVLINDRILLGRLLKMLKQKLLLLPFGSEKIIDYITHGRNLEYLLNTSSAGSVELELLHFGERRKAESAAAREWVINTVQQAFIESSSIGGGSGSVSNTDEAVQLLLSLLELFDKRIATATERIKEVLGDEVTYEKYHISIWLSSSRKEIIRMFSPPTPTTTTTDTTAATAGGSGGDNDEEK